MTLRARRPERVGIRTRLGRLVETEDRQQTFVTGLFIGAIVIVVLILIGAVALAWYNDNLRPLGRVGSVEIGPQMLRDSVALEQWRITRDESRITQAQIDGSLDATTASTKLSDLDQRAQDLSTNALDSLVDVIFQSQLATAEGITTGPGDVDALLQGELAAPEQRHVLALVIEPQAADATAGPTVIERHAALALAQQALVALQAGADWSTVAMQYGTDDKSKAGGDLGSVTQLGISDTGFGEQLFKLDVGAMTGVVLGDDGAYRIGRVTEITPTAEEPGLRSKLTKDVPLDSVQQLLGYEAAANQLKDKITATALSATPEQVKLAVIYIDGLYSGDTTTSEGEIDYSEIAFAPNDNIDIAPDLPAEDAAWTKAKEDADAAMATLQAITDIEQRKTTFAQMATDTSDDPTGQDGGAVGFVTRDIPPTAVADALFDGTFTAGDLVGPVRGDAAYYVILFNERRASPEDRVKAVQTALAAPGADFNAVAKDLSEGPEKADGGEVGWLTKDQLSTDIADQIFALNVGQISDPLEIQSSNGHYIVKVEDKKVRALDPDQVPNISANAFDNWYTPRRTDAEANGTIVFEGSDTTGGNLLPGTDQGTP